jgi:hypothetical protein
MSNKYPNSGALFYSQNRVHPNSPDLSGDISVDRTLLRQMLDETDEDDIKIRLSGWEKQGSKGPFFSLKVNTYKKPEQQPPQAPAQREIPPADDSDLPF